MQQFLVAAGCWRSSRSRWFWTPVDFPAFGLSLSDRSGPSLADPERLWQQLQLHSSQHRLESSSSGAQQLLIYDWNSFLLLFLNIYLFNLFWLLQVLVAVHRLLSCGMWTLSCSMHAGSSSLTSDRTWALCIGSVESHPLDHQGSSYDWSSSSSPGPFFSFCYSSPS